MESAGKSKKTRLKVFNSPWMGLPLMSDLCRFEILLPLRFN